LQTEKVFADYLKLCANLSNVTTRGRAMAGSFAEGRGLFLQGRLRRERASFVSGKPRSFLAIVTRRRRPASSGQCLRLPMRAASAAHHAAPARSGFTSGVILRSEGPL
jgi:hypothetical protein